MPSFQHCLISAGAESKADDEILLLGPPLEQPGSTTRAIASEATPKALSGISIANFLRIIRLLVKCVNPRGISCPRNPGMRLIIVIPTPAPTVIVWISHVVASGRFDMAITKD